MAFFLEVSMVLVKITLKILFIISFSNFCLIAKEISVEKFANLPETQSVKISPDGNKLALWVNLPSGDEMIITQDLKTRKVTSVLENKETGKNIYWFKWANNNQIVVSLRFYSQFLNQVVPNTRLLVVDSNGKNLKSVFSPSDFSRVDYMPSIQDNIVDWLDDDPNHFLIEIRNRSIDPAVMKVNLKSLSKKEYQTAKGFTGNWMTDQRNQVRVNTWRKSDEDEINVKINLFDSKKSEWFTAWEYEIFSDKKIIPLGFGENPDTLYVSAYHQGRQAIFTVDIASKELTRTLVYSHPKFDMDASLLYQENNKKPIGLNFSINGEKIIWDQKEKSFRQKLRKTFGGKSISIVSQSKDHNRYIVYADDISSPGMYYLGDKKSKTLAPIAERYPLLRDVNIPAKKVVSYKARDGLEIEAFLLIPAGSENEKLPTVIFPHGGPFAKDDYTFDYWSAFLVSRGYAVLQMNFRGSSGYGFDFLNAGVGNWGLAMQNDVVDGTKWLINNGISDPGKICIVGASYGGFAALLGAAKSSNLYQCAVSYAGVTDLLNLKSSSGNRKFTGRILGSSRKQLKENSPRYLANKIDIPLLIVHADMDSRVDISQARNLKSALEREGKKFTYIEQKGGDHFLSNQNHRVEFFNTMDKFLKKHLK